jgi:CheY-like chemotaxis protein
VRVHLPVVFLVGVHDDALAMHALGLLAMGFHPVTATTVEEALERARRVQPQAIVEYVAPSSQAAVELTRRFRDDQRTSDAVILALSSDIRTTGTQHLKDAGCDRVLPEPCPSDALALEIRDAMTSRAARLHAGL